MSRTETHIFPHNNCTKEKVPESAVYHGVRNKCLSQQNSLTTLCLLLNSFVTCGKTNHALKGLNHSYVEAQRDSYLLISQTGCHLTNFPQTPYLDLKRYVNEWKGNGKVRERRE